MEYHPHVLRVFPVVASDGRKFLDVVTDLPQEPCAPDPTLVSEIRRWATSYRDRYYPGRDIRYNWEANA